MRSFLAGAALLAVTLVPAGPSWAGDAAKTALAPSDVTIRVSDPTKGLEGGRDEEHVTASTTANAASTTEVDGGKPLPVAFTCVKVEPRP